LRTFLFANAVGISTAAFASYFDVYSHRHLFIGTDPWWNPAHLLLYAGFFIVLYGVASDRPKGIVGKISVLGLVLVLVAAAFNEVWHRILLFGNPLPEPFPVEPPHALLAVGLIAIGLAALLYPLADASAIAGPAERLAVAFIGGSLWLIVAGSALYVAGAYRSSPALLFAVGVASFSASLFLAYATGITGKFGFSTLSFGWFMLVYYTFFVPTTDGLPLGLLLVLVIDFLLSKVRISGISTRLLILPLIAALYGLIYYPILDPGLTIALNLGIVASALGVGLEYALERGFVRRLPSTK
jgi:hypothetical protein